MHKKLFLIPFLLAFPSCSVTANNQEICYLNYRYVLKRVGDLHGLNPRSNEVLDRNPGFTNYISLFNKKDSFINFQCVGSSFDDFKCETSFYFVDNLGTTIVNKVEPFYTTYSGEQSGVVKFKKSTDEELLGTIYVYTPYWCRWQFYYDVDNSGNPILLTAEFWKSSYNDLPDFYKNN